MKLRKLTAIVASTTLAAMLLAGCGSSDDNDTSSNDSSPKTEDTSSDKQDDTADKEDDTDAVSAATESEKSEDLITNMSSEGNWIHAIIADITLDNDLVVSGTFHDKNDDSKDVYRKLALYAQDGDKNVTAEYTLTVPTIIVNTPNFKIQNGTVVGNIVVAAKGFSLADTKLEGNLTFLSQELMDSADITGEVTGTKSVGTLKDGDYSIKYDGADTKGYTAYAKMTVAGGKITSAEYDYLDKDGNKKSENADYNTSMKDKTGVGPDTYTKDLAKSLVDSQNSANVDVVTGATHSSEAFIDFASRMIVASLDGKTDEIVLPQADK